jgi:hypothetical protein
MDNSFRSQLSAVLDEMLADGDQPVFLVIDLDGAEELRRNHGAETMQNFKDAALAAVGSATGGADAFTYGEDRIVAILDQRFDRLKTFALIQKLRRAIPLLGQSFDCFLRPECDVIEYDAQSGVSGLIARLAQPRKRATDETVA